MHQLWKQLINMLTRHQVVRGVHCNLSKWQMALQIFLSPFTKTRSNIENIQLKRPSVWHLVQETWYLNQAQNVGWKIYWELVGTTDWLHNHSGATPRWLSCSAFERVSLNSCKESPGWFLCSTHSITNPIRRVKNMLRGRYSEVIRQGAKPKGKTGTRGPESVESSKGRREQQNTSGQAQGQTQEIRNG